MQQNIQAVLIGWGAQLYNSQFSQQIAVLSFDFAHCAYKLASENNFLPEKTDKLVKCREDELRIIISPENFSRLIKKETSPQILHRERLVSYEGQAEAFLNFCILLDL